MATIVNQERTLRRSVPATEIPSGRPVRLHEGTLVRVTQALGDSLTVQGDLGLFRLEAGHADALGPDVAEEVEARAMAEAQAASGGAGAFGEEAVWEALRGCYDPEIPVNIVDLGLVYDVRIEPRPAGRHAVAVRMTLTATGCGMGPIIAEDARRRIAALPSVEEASVEVVWEPAWHPSRISAEGRRILGM